MILYYYRYLYCALYLFTYRRASWTTTIPVDMAHMPSSAGGSTVMALIPSTQFKEHALLLIIMRVYLLGITGSIEDSFQHKG